MVFYRKYRPQTISDLDSASVRETLTAILSGDVPHAFLFTGPKGLGKTSTARILAKAVNCERISKIKDQKSKTQIKSQKLETEQILSVEPCNECDQCVSITNGTNLDVMEIDAASNRGIDEIRELKDKIRLAPLKAARKVYIIDEVHMLTTEAFNALLKTLEEPPAHAMFVLCTTEPHKVPATILSRSFHIAFQTATPEELVRSFKRIADGEKLTIDHEALLAVSQIADGGFRDGAKIMEELAMIARGQPITKELIEERYRTGSVASSITHLVAALAEKDMKKSLSVISRLGSEGVDMKYVMQQLIDTLHTMLLVSVGITKTTQPVPFPSSELKELLLLLTRSHADVKYAVLPQIPLELAVIDWCEKTQNYAEQNVSSDQANAEPLGKENGVVTVQTTTTTVKPATEVNVKTLKKAIGNMQKIKALYGEQALPDIKNKPSDSINTAHVSLMHYSADSDTKEWVDNLWRNIISEMKAHNHTLAGVLRGCIIKSYDRKSLIIETTYTFHKEKLDDAKTKTILEEIIKHLTGNPVNVSIELRKN